MSERKVRLVLALGWAGASVVTGLAKVDARTPSGPADSEPEVCRWVDVASQAGVEFAHRSGASAAKHLPETMGSGVAWLDYDGDGWQDLYLVQSGPFPPSQSPGECAAAANRLFRNLGDGRFEDVTLRSGTGDTGYGQGAAAADVDGDGDVDLYVTNYGPDALLLNQGDGRFVESTQAPGLGGWSSSAAFADADGDGDLDLYVSRYVDYDPEHELFCGDVESGERTYCDPSLFLGAGDRFFVNRGNGRFDDATEAAGLGGANGRGLGVLFSDFDGDSHPDLYVANDLTINLLFRNRGDGTFEDLSLLSGTAVNGEGKPEAGMGVAAADFDGDGDPDLAVTNFDVETNTLYRNLGELQFDDASATSGFGVPSFNLLGFGIVADDLDLDGDLDIYATNGHIFQQPKRQNVRYRQRDLLLLGESGGRFTEQRCSGFEADPQVGRGLAIADFDLDGDRDLAVINNDGPFQLIENRLVSRRAIRIQLVGPGANRAAIGARLVLGSASGSQQTRWVTAGDSYQSSSERAVVFGLGADEAPQTLEVHWPSGQVERFNNLDSRFRYSVVEPVPDSP